MKKINEVIFFPVLVVAVMAISLAASLISQGAGELHLTYTFLLKQDVWLIVIEVVIVAACLWKLPVRTYLPETQITAVYALGFTMMIVAFAGHYLILDAYDMSRDEQLANFDAMIFENGRFVAQLPELWRANAEVLNTMYTHHSAGDGAWASKYLPANAAIRSVFALAGLKPLVSPAMVLLGAIALWGCVRRLWPEDYQSATVALLLYSGSAAVLVNGMTSYAMPAHLAINLCWLWLFMRQRWWADTIAIFVAFVAVGLHRPTVHPLFSAPVLATLLLNKEWHRSVYFFIGYLFIGLFWFWYPSYIADLIGPHAHADHVSIFDQIKNSWRSTSSTYFPLMIANLVRFVAWQHVLLIPLALLSTSLIKRNRIVAALAGGIFLTLLVRTFFQPYQGHGFGYRYLHGLIGNFILLAVFGWNAIKERLPQVNALILRTTSAGVLMVLPVQLYMANRFYAPYAEVSARIGRLPADYVVVGAADAPFAQDLVINDPFLEERPIRLLREFITPQLLDKVCASHPVMKFITPAELADIRAYYIGKDMSEKGLSGSQLPRIAASKGCEVKF
ncbi:hypothetical protein [Novosphingobium malaysiense]|uniref:Glycosyltransferase RgtA/B/C/D-like domain-containing protein n=1 Tax=Novosphingobium malaysiense TaxID=1348853 RepID=A0A0B1ZPM2_9SPHN|nr:hypothetical protein [Novosphingobium malaysiense]KHK91244.1 hypothetical protein LK12_10150 [Novosphingobium malaysiense]